MPQTICREMRRSIDFDHEASFGAPEIGSVGAQGLLASDLNAEELSIPEKSP
jgi:hypothetical protein